MKLLEDGKVGMTFDEYDLYVESAETCAYRCEGDWYPDPESAEYIADHFQDNVVFIIWILESCKERALTKKQQNVRKFLNNTMLEKLVLQDNPEEFEPEAKKKRPNRKKAPGKVPQLS